MLKIINVTFLTIYCSLIYWLSSKPTIPTPRLFIHQDKVFHFVAYFIMGILAWRFFYDHFTRPVKVTIASLFFCSLYGITDEWHQFFVIGRDASFLDWLADTMGASIAISILYSRVKKTNRYF